MTAVRMATSDINGVTPNKDEAETLMINKMAPTLYSMDASSPANAVRMFADIIGLDLELKHIDLTVAEQKLPEFLKINPIGSIPALKDGDFIVSDSHVIMKYLLSKYAADQVESLYPSDVQTRALVDQAMYFNTGVYFIKLKGVTLPSLFGDCTETTEKSKKDINDCYKVLEVFLENRKYIAADHLTLADIALLSTTSSMQPIHKLDSENGHIQNISKCRCVKDLGGDLLCEDLAVKDRWRSYFNELLNKQHKEVQPPDLPPDQGLVPPVTPAEVQTARRRSRNRKVVGADGVPIEPWKAMGPRGVGTLSNLFPRTLYRADPKPMEAEYYYSSLQRQMQTVLITQPACYINKMAPILYSMDASPPANAVRMFADIIGLDLELKQLDITVAEHKSPEYLKINPIGSIPTLKDGDFVLSESHVIMKYLLSKYAPDQVESLYPSDLQTRALVDQAMYFNTGVYFIRLKAVSIPSLFGDFTETPEKSKKDINDCYKVLEVFLENRKYIAADHLTLADIALLATTSSMQPIHQLDSEKFPRTAEWLSRLEQESFFKKIMVPGVELLDKILHSIWERNKQKKL
ncbi:unnamed protein product [Arctia plantaginis]|uniref:Glutathione S-transferase n=1 Tax=Arctia plantaginis TaxID=874455 RepID=A0A8S0YPR2_ARCPL|nr:unnamed protein product [Arctia plantaginis]